MEHPFDSTAAFEDEVERYREVGIDEFIFPDPLKKEQRPIFERIATDIVPRLRR
jgi:hypothetical protein